jgi:hypothetical protein
VGAHCYKLLCYYRLSHQICTKVISDVPNPRNGRPNPCESIEVISKSDQCLETGFGRAPQSPPNRMETSKGSLHLQVQTTIRSLLDIQVLDIQCIVFDELAPRFDILTHQRGEDMLGLGNIFKLDL